jgi:hypothetical protein
VYFSLAHGKENAGNLPHAGKQWCAWERDVYVTLILCRVSVRGHAAKPYRCNNSTKCISKGHVAPLFVVFLFSVVCIFGVFPCLLLCRLFSQFCCVYTLRRLFFWCFVVFLFIDMCPPMRSTTKGRAFWSTVKLWKHGKGRFFCNSSFLFRGITGWHGRGNNVWDVQSSLDFKCCCSSYFSCSNGWRWKKQRKLQSPSIRCRYLAKKNCVVVSCGRAHSSRPRR